MPDAGAIGETNSRPFAAIVPLPPRTCSLNVSAPLTPYFANFYIFSDGSPIGDQKGTRWETFPDAAAAPATVSGESCVTGHWVLGPREGDAR
jgi:hypothetical protein